MIRNIFYKYIHKFCIQRLFCYHRQTETCKCKASLEAAFSCIYLGLTFNKFRLF